MLRFRLWLSLFALLVSCGLLVVAGSTYLDEHLMPPFETQLINAETGLSGALDIDATDAIASVARLSANGAVRRVLAEGKSAPALDKATKDQLLTTAGGERVDVPTFALLLSASGEMLAEVGIETGLGPKNHGLPIFVETKSGVVRDGILRVKNKPYHVASAPVFSDRNGQLLGVIILGWRYSSAYVAKLAEMVGRPVFLIDQNLVLSSTKSIAFSAEALKKGVKLGGIGEVSINLPVFPSKPILGSEDNPPRYLATHVPIIHGEQGASLAVLVDRDDAFQTIAAAQFFVLLGSLILFVLMALLTAAEQRAFSRPMDTLLEHLSAMAQGEGSEILPEAELKGPFLRLGKQLNMILQANQGPASSFSGANPVANAGSSGIALNVGQTSSDDAPPLTAAPGATPIDVAGINPDIGLEPSGGPAQTGPVALGAIPLKPAAAGTGANPIDSSLMGSDSGPNALFPGAPAPAGAPAADAPGMGPAPTAPQGAAPMNPAPTNEGGLSGLFDDNPNDPLAAFRVGAGPSAAPAAMPAQTTQPPLPGSPADSLAGGMPGASPFGAPAQTNPAMAPMTAEAMNPLDGGQGGGDAADFNPDATRMFEVPEALIRESAAAGQQSTGTHQVPAQMSQAGGAPLQPPPQPEGMAPTVIPGMSGGPAAGIEETEDRTVVAQVPADLLSIAAVSNPDVTPEEESHFRQVHQEFLAMRTQCGEDTAGLTYEKFLAKLMKNRQQIRDKYQAKTVRFQVYEKNGKAALRAVPVRDGT